MFRAVCVIAGLVAFAGPTSDIDATAFALAFRAGNADQYKNRQISGSGTSFHGAITERLADGSTRTSLVITLGASDASGKVAPLNSWEAFVAAERERTTLVVALSGPNLPAPPTNGPTVYEFSGVYDGQVRTIPRAPVEQTGELRSQTSNAGQSASPEGPCRGETPRDQPQQRDSFYCAPLLTGATATVRR
jgi:hypothetical protein